MTLEEPGNWIEIPRGRRTGIKLCLGRYKHSHHEGQASVTKQQTKRECRVGLKSDLRKYLRTVPLIQSLEWAAHLVQSTLQKSVAKKKPRIMWAENDITFRLWRFEQDRLIKMLLYVCKACNGAHRRPPPPPSAVSGNGQNMSTEAIEPRNLCSTLQMSVYDPKSS